MKTLDPRQTAHIIVDYQNDFVKPWAPLYVPWAELLEDQIESNIKTFEKHWIQNIYTADWHPKWHISLASTHWEKPFTARNWDILRPDHCMQNTRWANIYGKIWDLSKTSRIVRKWVNKNDLGYSWFDNTELDKLLKSKDIHNLFISGVATDYCIKATALDALKLKYNVFVLWDCIKAVNGKTTQDIYTLLEEAWWYIIQSDDIYFAKNNGKKEDLLLVNAFRKVDQERADRWICA